MKNYKFPKRFEVENLDPSTLKVKVVAVGASQVYENLAAAEEALGDKLAKMAGPMADKIDGVWCVRFETWGAYDALSV